MKFAAFIAVALAGFVAAVPQGVGQKIAPSAAAPAGCSTSVSGQFEVTIIELTKRDTIPVIQKRDTCPAEGILVLGLDGGVLTDSKGRAGYIASNFQFQFDSPPQSGALFTAGFSVCGNGTLALGGSTTFYQCLSGSFYNLYDRHWAPQCSPIHINIMPCGGTPPDKASEGKTVGTTLVPTTVVSVLPDGQPQAHPTVVPVPVCQIGDGQPQAHTTPCAALPPKATATAPPAPVGPTGKPISQIPDGQIQVPPPKTAVSPPAGGAPGAPAAPGAPGAKPSAPGAPGAPGATGAPGSPTGTAARPSAPASVPTGTGGARPPASPTSVPSQAGANFASSSLIALAIGIFGAVFAL